MLRHGLVPEDAEREEMDIEDEEVDVPQHESIGIVKSWQTDGAETEELVSFLEAKGKFMPAGGDGFTADKSKMCNH